MKCISFDLLTTEETSHRLLLVPVMNMCTLVCQGRLVKPAINALLRVFVFVERSVVLDLDRHVSL